MSRDAATDRGGRFGAAFGTLIVMLLASLWMSNSHQADSVARPTVLLSLDRTLFHRLGLSRLTYRRALLRAGARVRLLNDSARGADEPDRRAASRLLEGVHGLVLSGGGDIDPRLYGGELSSSLDVRSERDRFELALLGEAEARGLPILGICRGAQLLNVARGGSLRTIRSDPELKRRHGRFRTHPVEIEPGSRLAELLAAERVGRAVSYHGQAVDRPGEGLAVVGRAADGIVEAIEPADGGSGRQSWILGVQWHPELSRGQQHGKLFRGLVDAARAYRSGGA